MCNIGLLIAISLLALTAIGAGSMQLRKAFRHSPKLPEEFALAVAWVFAVASLVWLTAYLCGFTILGFGSPWSWLAAAHFFFAGFGALTVTALCCRCVSHPLALRVLRTLLFIHPLAYLITAGGIMGYPYCDEMGASLYQALFISQLACFLLGDPSRLPRGPKFLLVFALIVPTCTMVPALFWAWRTPILDLFQMVRYHGIVNAVGHIGLAFGAFAWGRPSSHATPSNSPS
ncbi:MAG: YndJ family transporter [Akkermansiaceae bacterium]|nr:YndJ family transporter [Akkermansiaceae bacterium]